MFYEVYANEEYETFDVYAILEEGRQTKISLVYSSDCYFSFGNLEQKSKLKERSHPKTERGGGNMFGYLFDLQGKFIPPPLAFWDCCIFLEDLAFLLLPPHEPLLFYE
jgi:hypothetical protein